jgi:hypothetical protein
MPCSRALNDNLTLFYFRFSIRLFFTYNFPAKPKTGFSMLLKTLILREIERPDSKDPAEVM